MLTKRNWLQCGLALTLGSAIWFGCGSSNNNSPSPGPAVTPAVPTPTVTVTIPAGATALGSAAYGTNPLNINPSNVIWVNNDTTPHSATSDTGIWDTGVIQPGATSSPVPFQSPGSFPYGSSVSGDGNMSGEIVVASPSPSPSPSPSSSSSPMAVGWTQVSIQQTCPFPECAAGDGFTVTSDGAYLTGSGNSGHITHSQLNVLSASANAVAQSSSQLGYSCVDQPAPPGATSSTVDETFTTGGTQQIYSYDTDTGQLCIRGSKANAQNLHDAMLALALVYDNGATPSPSPSPSESPTASPSPEPSPSESMMMVR